LIFGITGTHEQPFERLVLALDSLAKLYVDREPFVLQMGYFRGSLKYASGQRMYANEEMQTLARKARIIVTHAGPGSIWLAFQHNKIPIVVPRMKKHGEHVDDHQLAFANQLSSESRAIVVTDTTKLRDALLNYGDLVLRCTAPGISFEANRRKLFRMLEDLLS
jgi:UDP-N-acetylglucosamine transferase subunit ALG13